MLWCRNPVNAQKMQQDRVNEKYLPGIKFKDTLTVSCSLEEVVRASKNVLVVVPSHTFADVLTAIKPFLQPDQRIAWATKGLD